MFTGIVEELGDIEGVEPLGDSARLTIRGPLVTEDAFHGASIAVNGVCLTVVDLKDGAFTADVMKESLDRSSLGALRQGSKVNLERPVRLQDRLGGHLVQGHVDGTGRLTSMADDGFARRLGVFVPEELRRYVAERGSVAIDGVSLTVAGIAPDGLDVSLIPETLERTTLGDLAEGDRVNLEVDVVARYAERLVQGLNAEGSEG